MRTKIALSLILFCSFCRATPCIRGPEVPFSVFQDRASACSPLSTTRESLVDRNLDPALSRLVQKIENHPDKAKKYWRDFLHQLRGKIWSPRHAQVAREIEMKLQLQVTPSLQENMQDPTTREEPAISFSLDGAEGWEDALIFKNGFAWTPHSSENIKEQLVKEDTGNWVAYSSRYRPLIVWGTGSHLLEKILGRNNVSWTERNCSPKELEWNGQNLKWEVFRSNPCPAPNLFQIEKPQQSLWSGLPRLQKEKPFLQGALALAVLGVLALGLKDKKLVIRK